MGESPMDKVADAAGAAREAAGAAREAAGNAAGAARETVASAGKAVADQVRDPVCGRWVRPGNRKLRYVYAEETYYFHAGECLDRFAEQPEVFLSHEGEEGDKASFDRARRPEAFQHRGELRPGTPITLEQPRVESGSG